MTTEVRSAINLELDGAGIRTIDGRGLAAFLRGLLPETTQFHSQIAAIEQEARAAALREAAERVRVLPIPRWGSLAFEDCRDAAIRAIEDQSNA